MLTSNINDIYSGNMQKTIIRAPLKITSWQVCYIVRRMKKELVERSCIMGQMGLFDLDYRMAKINVDVKNKLIRRYEVTS